MSEPKIARFRSRKYVLDIARTPGEPCVLNNVGGHPIVYEHRTMWRFEFADEKAIFDFIAQHGGTLDFYNNNPWKLHSVSKTSSRSREIKPRLFWRVTDSYKVESFRDQLARWKNRYPEAAEGKLMQLVLYGRRAGLPESQRNAVQEHQRLNERYQRVLVANRQLVTDLRTERAKMKPVQPDPRIPDAIKMLVQQQLLFWRYAHDDKDEVVFAIGLRLDTNIGVNDLISSLTYFHGKGDEAVAEFRRRCDEHALMRTEDKLALYAHGWEDRHPNRDGSGIAMVTAKGHDMLAYFSRMRSTFRASIRT